MLDLPVIVLCGGLGTRLRSVVSDRPKSLAPVGNEPFLSLQLKLLRKHGARRFVLCVGHLGEQIEAVFGNGSELGVSIEYVHDGERLLGTGGAIKRAERFFDPQAIVVNGDTYLEIDLQQLLYTHTTALDAQAQATFTVAWTDDLSRFGRIELAGNRVTGFHEKNPTATGGGWMNAGAYVLTRQFLSRIPADEVVSLERDVFPRAIQDGVPLAAYQQEQLPHDIGTPDDFQAFAARREAPHAP